MKKQINWVIVAALGMMTIASCNKLDKGTRYINEGGDNFRVKTLSLGDPIYKTYTYVYDEDGSLKTVDLAEDGWAETFTFDYSTPGQISLGEGKIIKLNDQGLCKEYVKNADESMKYDYNAEGYMTKAYEIWQGGTPELKSTMIIEGGNVTKWSKFSKQAETGDTEKVEHFKKFTYGAVANLRGIYQANSDYGPDMWMLYTGMFGKPSKTLATSYIWEYVEGNPAKLMTCEITFSADGITPKTETRKYGGSYDNAYTYGWEAK